MAGSDDFPALVSERVRAYRALAGKTQGQVAEASGLPVNTISRCERGERAPLVATLTRIARALDLTVSDLIGDAEDGFTLEAAGLEREASHE